MTDAGRSKDIRLAELVAGLSLVIDLGLGQPVEHVLRQTQLAMRLGELLGMTEEDRPRSTTSASSRGSAV